MTLYARMLENFTVTEGLELFLRIVVACICGAMIGFERTKRFKEAGIRTHILVACTAAAMMIVSKYGFADLGGAFGASTADPARIAAQVVSGVSFLGAGMIFRHGSKISGLTTAAGIWATAGIGLAVGAGMYAVGLFATIIILVLQMLMHRFAIGNDAFTTRILTVTVAELGTVRKDITAHLERLDMQVSDNRFCKNGDGTYSYTFVLKYSKQLDFGDVADYLAAFEAVRSFDFHAPE